MMRVVVVAAACLSFAGARVVNYFEANETVVSVGRWGYIATLLSDSVVGDHLRKLGEWEQPIAMAMAEVVRPGDTVWEAGANVGAHTIALSAMVGPTGRVEAFEPQPRMRSLLSTTLSLNQIEARVNVHSVALGGPDDNGRQVAGSACFSSAEEQCLNDYAVNPGLFSLADAPDSPSRGLKIASLDALVDAGRLEGCPRLIKSDVEGMDLRLLQGALQTLERCRPFLLFELGEPRETFDEALNMLPDFYDCAWLNFRIIPSERTAYQLPLPPPPTGMHPTQRTGAMSINLFCSGTGRTALQEAAESAAEGDLFPATKNGPLYLRDDCAEYVAALKELHTAIWYQTIVGDAASFCGP